MFDRDFSPASVAAFVSGDFYMCLWWLPNSTRYYSLDARVLDAGSLVNHEIAGARSGFGEVLTQADVRKLLEVLWVLIAVGVAMGHIGSAGVAATKIQFMASRSEGWVARIDILRCRAAQSRTAQSRTEIEC